MQSQVHEALVSWPRIKGRRRCAQARVQKRIGVLSKTTLFILIRLGSHIDE